MHKVRSFPQQLFPFAERFPYQAQLPVFQVTQPTMDDACRTAGYSGGKIVLLHQQRVLARTGALPGNSDAVNSPPITTT